MNTKYSTFFAVIVLINDITIMSNTFLLFASIKADSPMWIDYLPWLGCTLAVLFLNRLFLRKPKKIIHLALFNSVLGSAFISAGLIYLVHAQGVTPYIYAALFFLYALGRSIWLAANPVPERYLILYTEFSVLGAGFFFFTQTSPFHAPLLNNLACILTVILNVTSLVRLRVFGENQKSTAVSKWQGNFLLLALLGIMSGLVLSFFLFLSAPMGSFLRQVIEVTLTLLKWVGYQASRLILFLFSLIPISEKDIPLMPGNSSKPINAEDASQFDFGNLVYWLLIAGGMAALVIVVYLVIHYRKRLSGGFLPVKSHNASTFKTSNGIFAILMEFIRKMVRKVKFGLLFIRLRNTPEGVFLIIEAWGGRRGIPRNPYETSTAYLRRLPDALETVEKVNLNPLISKLAIILEEKFYSREPQVTSGSCCLDRREIKTLGRYFSF